MCCTPLIFASLYFCAQNWSLGYGVVYQLVAQLLASAQHVDECLKAGSAHVRMAPGTVHTALHYPYSTRALQFALPYVFHAFACLLRHRDRRGCS